MASAVSAEVVKFHLSLNVSDLTRAIGFYRVLFDREPAKVKADYAKFEVDEPPLIMSLIPTPPGAGGPLNHVGLRLLNAEALVAAQARLEQAGYATQREEGVECCYSKQTKFWVTDPDRTLWELYVLHDDDGDDHQVSHTASTVVAIESLLKTATPDIVAPPHVVWQHLLVQPLPERIEHADASVDEIQLQGTLNLQILPERLAKFLQEARRVLKPGGSIHSHNLGADRPLAERPALPGPASLVESVPVESTAVKAFEQAGFVGVEITKLGQSPCFSVGECQLREMRIVAHQPETACCTSENQTVLYKGPLRQVADDLGNIFPRGDRVVISSEASQRLRSGPLSSQFTFFAPVASSGCCD